MLDENEKLVAEAIDSMLQHDAKLGLSIHDKDDNKNKTERGYEYVHNNIDDMFALKAADLTHATGVCQAFTKVHNYKYIDDPSFATAMKKEMVAQGIPTDEREKAIGFISQICDDLETDKNEWAEKDFGFNPELDDMIEASQPEQPTDFNIEDVDDWSNDSNVDWEDGDASMGKI